MGLHKLVIQVNDGTVVGVQIDGMDLLVPDGAPIVVSSESDVLMASIPVFVETIETRTVERTRETLGAMPMDPEDRARMEKLAKTRNRLDNWPSNA